MKMQMQTQEMKNIPFLAFAVAFLTRESVKCKLKQYAFALLM